MALADAELSTRFILVVKALVKELGSQAAAAEALGVSTPYVGRIVRDEISSVRNDTVNRASLSVESMTPLTLYDVLEGKADPEAWAVQFRMAPSLQRQQHDPLIQRIRASIGSIARAMALGEPVDSRQLRELVEVLTGSQSFSLARRLEAMSDAELVTYGPSLIRAVETEFAMGSPTELAIARRGRK